MKVKRIKRRKFNFKKFFKFLLFLSALILGYIYISDIPIKNIIVKGNNHITDEEIIETAKIEDYPSFIKTHSYKIKNKIEKIPLIKNVEIKKRWGYKIEINIVEYKVLFQIRSSGEYILDTGKKLGNLKINTNSPVLINYVPDDVEEKMIKKFSKIDENIITKISEIEYSPTDFDTERFLLYMNDENEVYITLNKIKELNKYTNIKKQIGESKGILYLDSGNYFEIKE